MALVVHDGLQFAARDYPELAQHLRLAFQHFDSAGRRHVTKYIVGRAVTQCDADWVTKRREGSIPVRPDDLRKYLEKARSHWWQEFGRVQRGNPADGAALDGRVRVMFWSGPDGHFYGRLVTAVEGLREWLIEQGIATTFDYWNDAPPSSSVSPSEWDYRFYIWDEVLSGTWGQAASFEGTALYPFLISEESVRQLMPEIQVRAEALASAIVYSQWMQTTHVTPPSPAVTRMLQRRFRERVADPRDVLATQVASVARQLVDELPAIEWEPGFY